MEMRACAPIEFVASDLVGVLGPRIGRMSFNGPLSEQLDDMVDRYLDFIKELGDALWD